MATAPAWLPGVTRVSSTHDGGTLLDGPRRMTWHTFEAPYQLTAVQGAQSLIRAGNEAHFVLHPRGGLVQLLPASRAARTLANPPWGVQTNRLGTVHLQVEVIGWAARPFTSDLTVEGRRDLARLVAYARSLGIPDVWPAGPPPRYPGGVSARGQRTWLMKAGHFAHSQVPENDHGDPGAVDVRVLLARPPVTPPVIVPRRGDNVLIITTPVNGSFAVWPDGDHMAYSRIDAATAGRWMAGGIPHAELGAADATALMKLQATIQDPTVPPVDVQQLATEIVAALPPITAVGGPSSTEIADAVLSRIQLTQRAAV